MKGFATRLALCGLVATPLSMLSAQAIVPITEATSGTLIETAYTPIDGVIACDWSPDDSEIAAANANGVYTVDLMFPDSPPVALPEQLAPVLDLVYSPDGADLVLAGPDQIQVWDRDSESRRLRLDGTGPVAVSTDSALVAYTDGGSQMFASRLEDGAQVSVMQGHEDRITDVGFAPTGQYLASSSLDNTLRLWDIATGDQFRFQRSRNRPQLALDVNRYGSSVASGTTGGVARLLNVAITTEGLYRLQPRSDVVDVEYTPDGLLLALAGGHSLYLWSMDNHEPPVVYNLSAPLSCLSFNADASELLVGTGDGLHIFSASG